jgi:hypothetical protein
MYRKCFSVFGIAVASVFVDGKRLSAKSREKNYNRPLPSANSAKRLLKLICFKCGSRSGSGEPNRGETMRILNPSNLELKVTVLLSLFLKLYLFSNRKKKRKTYFE